MTDKLEIRRIRPFLSVKRLLVLKSGRAVYDQEFQLGVNIIRGDNGTGKTTIMDLLYFALGAELTDWTEEQERCDETMVEILLNYRSYVLRREIVESGKSAMYFYEGTVDDTLKDSEHWLRYPNMRSADTHSYSQQLFDLLNLPTHKTDESKNLTMHQILRLMYVDQLSETTRLLKEDKKYDNDSMRRAIGEYMLGIDDLEAHNLRQELIVANRSFDAVNSELKAIYRFVGSDDAILRNKQIDAEISRLTSEIDQLEAERAQARQQKYEVLDEKIRERIQLVNEALVEFSFREYELKQRKDEISTELVDTSLFLNSLIDRKAALEQSRVASDVIGALVFKYCPACLTPLDNHVEEGHCVLCKSDLTANARHYSYIQMANEINFQVKESEKLIERFHEEIDGINSDLASTTRRIRSLKEEYIEYSSNADQVDLILSQLGSEIGYRKNEIETFESKRSMVAQIDELVERKESLNERITQLQDQLDRLTEMTKDRHTLVYTDIEKKAKTIIAADGGYENVFEDVEEVTLDFGRDKMFVNGRSKFSASSMTIMKNAIRMAVFLHCIQDDLARFPRFLMLDNVEDKGMTEDRSQNFQRVIVAACDSMKDDYQLIFTTSMIDPELNKSEYVVGPFYKKGEHTLQFM
tara:strand:- start:3587 stop:5506 length:1920 start_codon:yes stop_codon:yes gene_type:complete